MTVGELIQILQTQVEENLVSEDTTVGVVYQPNYPLATSLHGVYRHDPEDAAHNDGPAGSGLVVFLVANDGELREYGSPYGPRNAWEDAEVAC